MSIFNPFSNLVPVRVLEGARVGDTVLKFQCDGCMAHEHNFKWVGQINRFEPGQGFMGRYNFAVVTIIKQGHEDSRDHDLGEDRLVVEDGSFQRLGPRLWGYFK